MIRTVFIMIVWMMALGLLSIEATFADGLTVDLKGWPELLEKRLIRKRGSYGR